ncbi:MAG: ATP-binding cassette domain-containing protein [Flavobacteriales bacterium]|nr:ATP-binding cassette domain-containing protein [Flavobacteriales bacterium]
MSSIALADVGKRFNRDWIFRHVSHTFRQDAHTVIVGANGSGKSTLLQVILGSLVTSEGTVSYDVSGKQHAVEDGLGLFSMATPYLELIEEYTLREMLAFHGSLRPFRGGLTHGQIIASLYLEEAADRPIRYYSSGMRQRVKLGLALLSDTPFVLLDEPTANLDRKAMDWYADLVTGNMGGRTVIVCSNAQEQEHFFCTDRISVDDFK